MERKTILLISDDIRAVSGIAHIAREIVYRLCNRFNFVLFGGLHANPNNGMQFDYSETVRQETGVEDANVKIISVSDYGTQELIAETMRMHPIEAIFIITDPRYYIWLFDIEREIRQKVPIIWYTIWDNVPTPHWNRPYYQSCDSLLCISKLTQNLVRELVPEVYSTYIPHGVDETIFRPMLSMGERQDVAKFNTFLFGNRKYDFVLLYDARNIHRKRTSDTMMAWAQFTQTLTPEQREKSMFLLHTDIIDRDGTDLDRVAQDCIVPKYPGCNIAFLPNRLTPSEMNLLYNVSDAVILASDSEGWGLSITQALLTGKPFVATVTGGLQDQMGFVDDDGNPMQFTPEFQTNSTGRYNRHGRWAFPVFPVTSTINGSPITPYIYADYNNPADVARAIERVYNVPKTLRQEIGLEGRQWAIENGLTAHQMANHIGDEIQRTLDTFVPRPTFEIIPA